MLASVPSSSSTPSTTPRTRHRFPISPAIRAARAKSQSRLSDLGRIGRRLPTRDLRRRSLAVILAILFTGCSAVGPTPRIICVTTEPGASFPESAAPAAALPTEGSTPDQAMTSASTALTICEYYDGRPGASGKSAEKYLVDAASASMGENEALPLGKAIIEIRLIGAADEDPVEQKDLTAGRRSRHRGVERGLVQRLRPGVRGLPWTYAERCGQEIAEDLSPAFSTTTNNSRTNRRMVTANFCPSCGTPRGQPVHFCASCGCPVRCGLPDQSRH